MSHRDLNLKIYFKKQIHHINCANVYSYKFMVYAFIIYANIFLVTYQSVTTIETINL